MWRREILVSSFPTEKYNADWENQTVPVISEDIASIGRVCVDRQYWCSRGTSRSGQWTGSRSGIYDVHVNFWARLRSFPSYKPILCCSLVDGCWWHPFWRCFSALQPQQRFCMACRVVNGFVYLGALVFTHTLSHRRTQSFDKNLIACVPLVHISKVEDLRG